MEATEVKQEAAMLMVFGGSTADTQPRTAFTRNIKACQKDGVPAEVLNCELVFERRGQPEVNNRLQMAEKCACGAGRRS